MLFPHSVRHPRTPATLLGTEGCSELLLQRRRSSALGFTRHLPPGRTRSPLHSNPAEMLFTPPTVATPSRRVLTPEQVQQILQVLPVREQSRKRRTIHYFDSEEHTPAPERSIRSIRLR